jgi:hypothetical protein
MSAHDFGSQHTAADLPGSANHLGDKQFAGATPVGTAL